MYFAYGWVQGVCMTSSLFYVMFIAFAYLVDITSIFKTQDKITR